MAELWFDSTLTDAVCVYLERRPGGAAPTLPTASAAIATMAIMIVTFAMSNLSFVSTNTPFSGSVGQDKGLETLA